MRYDPSDPTALWKKSCISLVIISKDLSKYMDKLKIDKKLKMTPSRPINKKKLQGVPKYSTHLFMTLYILMVMDSETETAFILTPICVALKWVVNELWRCWGTEVMVKTNSAIQIRKTHKVFENRMIFNEWPKVNN